MHDGVIPNLISQTCLLHNIWSFKQFDVHWLWMIDVVNALWLHGQQWVPRLIRILLCSGVILEECWERTWFCAWRSWNQSKNEIRRIYGCPVYSWTIDDFEMQKLGAVEPKHDIIRCDISASYSVGHKNEETDWDDVNYYYIHIKEMDCNVFGNCNKLVRDNWQLPASVKWRIVLLKTARRILLFINGLHGMMRPYDILGHALNSMRSTLGNRLISWTNVGSVSKKRRSCIDTINTRTNRIRS